MTENTTTAGPGVYRGIAAVMQDIGRQGIEKDRKNQGQGYQFRGIDDVYNALNPVLARHGLCVIPQHRVRVCEERQTAKGGVMFYTTVESDFLIVSAEDGSSVTAHAFGEAMDTADKATNKAMSASFKYMAMQLFCIPTKGDNDADAHSPEPVRARMSDRDKAQLVVWMTNTKERIENVRSEADLDAIRKDPQFIARRAELWDSARARLDAFIGDRDMALQPALDAGEPSRREG